MAPNGRWDLGGLGWPLLGHELCYGLFGLLGRRCYAVPAHLVFHERDALALDGLRNDERGLARTRLCGVHRIRNGVKVVSIDGHDVPTKGAELVLDGVDGHDITVVAVNLQVIVIDEGDDVVEPVVLIYLRYRRG